MADIQLIPLDHVAYVPPSFESSPIPSNPRVKTMIDIDEFIILSLIGLMTSPEGAVSIAQSESSHPRSRWGYDRIWVPRCVNWVLGLQSSTFLLKHATFFVRKVYIGKLALIEAGCVIFKTSLVKWAKKDASTHVCTGWLPQPLRGMYHLPKYRYIHTISQYHIDNCNLRGARSWSVTNCLHLLLIVYCGGCTIWYHLYDNMP